MNYNFIDLKNQIKKSAEEHNSYQTLDGFLYNSFVIIAVICSSASSILIDKMPDIAKILTLVSAVLISIDRALNFGARWLYHRTMRHEYLSILARIDLVENSSNDFNEEERKKYFLLIFDDFFALKRRESLIPGVTDSKSR